MNGNVFQTLSENGDRKQFERTREALQRYALTELTHSQDMLPIVRDLDIQVIAEPDDISAEDEKSKLKVRLWEKRVDAYAKRLDVLEENKKEIYAAAWGQCSKPMKEKVRMTEDFEEMNKACNPLWLLKTIKAVSYQFEGQRNTFLALDDAKSNLFAHSQGHGSVSELELEREHEPEPEPELECELICGIRNQVSGIRLNQALRKEMKPSEKPLARAVRKVRADSWEESSA